MPFSKGRSYTRCPKSKQLDEVCLQNYDVKVPHGQ